jgi:hypothetical protein
LRKERERERERERATIFSPEEEELHFIRCIYMMMMMGSSQN